MNGHQYYFKTNCVNSTGTLITPMVEQARDVTRRTFLRHVNRESLNEVTDEMGYSRHPKQGLTLAGDYHVSYHRSTFAGKPCYFLRWSLIEYVFTEVA